MKMIIRLTVLAATLIFATAPKEGSALPIWSGDVRLDSTTYDNVQVFDWNPSQWSDIANGNQLRLTDISITSLLTPLGTTVTGPITDFLLNLNYTSDNILNNDWFTMSHGNTAILTGTFSESASAMNMNSADLFGAVSWYDASYFPNSPAIYAFNLAGSITNANDGGGIEFRSFDGDTTLLSTPEPSTYILTLLGFAAVFLTARRRRSD